MDSRCNGASMRFWESFYGIGWSNCLNTPHGWSSWTGQMHYQLYLSTQDTYYLHKFMTNITASLSVLISPAANGAAETDPCIQLSFYIEMGVSRACLGKNCFYTYISETHERSGDVL